MWKQRIPNMITVMRMLGACVSPLLFYEKRTGLLVLLFLVISWSDFLDGFLARLWRAESVFGKICDPIADKLLTLCYMCGLFLKFDCPAYIVCLYLSRDFVLSVGALFLLQRGGASKIQVTLIGKWSTVIQWNYIMVSLLVAYWPSSGALSCVWRFLEWLSVGGVLFSLYDYSQSFWRKRNHVN